MRQHPQAAHIIRSTYEWIAAILSIALLPLFVPFIGMFEMTFLILGLSVIAAILLAAVQSRINALRPCEYYDFDPFVPQAKSERSFPSIRAFVVSEAAFWMYLSYSTFFGATVFSWVPLAVVTLALALLLLQILGGVSFPRDVIVGASAGILVGILGIVCMGAVKPLPLSWF